MYLIILKSQPKLYIQDNFLGIFNNKRIFCLLNIIIKYVVFFQTMTQFDNKILNKTKNNFDKKIVKIYFQDYLDNSLNFMFL